MSDFNERVIAEFRENGGHVTTGGFGSSLVLLHSVGAKSGEERLSPVLAIGQPDGTWLIAASKAGAPDNPAWYWNLKAAPDATIETAGADGIETVEVTAEELEGDERDRAWAQFTSRSEGFKAYEARTGGRIIPVVRLRRR